jgi:hypothetical protein
VDQFEALIGAGQLGVAISGLAGVVFALLRREAFSLPENRFRLTTLFETGLGACLFSLVPQLLWGLLPAPNIWALSSAVWVLYGLFAMGRAVQRIRRDRSQDSDLRGRVSAAFAVAALTGGLVVLLIQVVNVMAWQAFHAYFLAVVYLLVIAVLSFMRLLAAEPAL